ncbi:MAG TPA: hypothetical protein VK427_09135 [Kofleriaceae bacterium]|nr:hypothetical protein [Kofleriaceae bacterium]
MKTLARVQRGLEALYRLDTGLDVHEFLVGADIRDELVSTRRPKEQLLVCEEGGEMSLALFIDQSVLDNLANHQRLDSKNFGDFILAVEGVSHFIYTICCARAERPVSQLELELQAEVDKYVTCLLATAPETDVSQALRHRLFEEPAYEPDLDEDESERYRAANDNALRYTSFLHDQFVARRKIPEMLVELRRFYRQGLAAKLSMIARAA